MEITKEAQIIFSAKLAKELLSKGFQIVGLDCDKANPERTVFFFKVEDGIYDIISKYKRPLNSEDMAYSNY